GSSVVTSKSSGSGLAGFEGASVRKATAFGGRIDVDLGTSQVRAGDAYTFRATFTNTGCKPIKIREATSTFTTNGEARVVPLTPDAMEVLPQKSVVLTDTGGIWEDEIETWSLQIAVTSDK